jgi:hypothetical protein
MVDEGVERIRNKCSVCSESLGWRLAKKQSFKKWLTFINKPYIITVTIELRLQTNLRKKKCLQLPPRLLIAR